MDLTSDMLRYSPIRRFLAGLLSFFLIFTAVLPVSAAASSGALVRLVSVGLFTGEGYAEVDRDGHWSGIDVEITENIAQTAGFKVSFVEETSLQQAFQDLEDGKIDMLADIAKTEEREKKYLYSDYEQGSVGNNIFVPESDDRWDYENLEQFRTMTFSCERENIAGTDFRSWCSQRGFTPNIVLYDSGAEAVKAVTEGKADAYVDGEDFLSGFKSILSFAPAPYYYIFAKGSMDLKQEVDTALGQIYIQDPLYEKELLDKYVNMTQNRTVAFSEDEKAYIASNPVVHVAVLKGDAPYFSGTAEAPQGIIPEFYRQVAGETGLTFKYLVYDNQEKAISAVLSGEADIVGMYSENITQAYDQDITLTKKYTTVSTVLITNAGTDSSSIKKIAVKERSRTTIRDNLPDELRDAEMISCETAEDCFNALTDKRADAVVIGLPSVTYFLNQRNPSAYSMTTVPSVNLDLCAAARSDHHTLVMVLDKGIDAASYLINGIITSNTVSGSSLEAIIARIPAGIIVSFSCIMVFLVLLLLWAVVALIRSRKVKIAAVRSEAEARELRIKAEASEKSAEEKNAFFANISHDMRTPLNGILGFADLAEKQDSLDKAKNYIGKIKLSGNLLLNLINDTLTISKAENGKLELKPEPVSTEMMTAGLTDSIQSLAARKGVEFTVDRSGLRPRAVLADKLNLEKILLNLLSNAVKFTPPGGHVRYTVYDDPKGSQDPDIVATVADDGIGMSEEYMRHMYEPFSQEKRHGYESVGTGLGLSIVKQLTELMGGTVTVKSRPGEGTTFTVRLHLDEVPPESVKTEKGLPAESLSALQGKKILLCEDNMLNREIASALLKDKGMLPVMAENGQIGLDIFSHSGPREFSAILMDVRMPVLDGYETTKRIRALNRPDSVTVPIIAMTADAFADDVHRCLDAGMNGHIAKPIDPEKLTAKLAEVLT
ncbi:MAG: transporter substrate-binding domain-containing protein [Lachnospiraceae bacterium]|nr:transporter substrate-binding domain-containing protein [Lachnospiraceae bacterium]